VPTSDKAAKEVF